MAAQYGKADFWARKARNEGYPARSVYKLQEIDERFGLLPAGNAGSARPVRVLDLGAAPGSWSLYVLRKLGPAASVAACDLSPISAAGLFAGPNFHFVQGDLTAGETASQLAPFGPFDLVLSDAAPATTGSRAVDTARSRALVEAALDWAGRALVPGGALVAKVFQGEDQAALLAALRRRFERARAFKPKSCRANSFETYLVASGLR